MTTIQQIQGNDHAALKQLHKKYEPLLLKYLEQQLGCTDTAAEITQRTFIKLWENRSSLDTTLPDQAIVFRIAKTTLIDYTRQRHRELKRQYAWTSKPANTGHEYIDVETPELNRKIQETIDKLPYIRKQVFTMHRMDGYTYQEIAGQLQISVKSVEHHLVQSVRFLRQSLKAEDYTLFLISLFFIN